MDKYPKHGGEESAKRLSEECTLEEIQRLGKLSLNHMREIKSVDGNPFYNVVPIKPDYPDIAAYAPELF